MLISEIEKKKKINLLNSDSSSIIVGGWIKLHRESKDLIFIELNDGSSLNNLQIVFSKKQIEFNILKKLKLGSYLKVEGVLFTFNKSEKRKWNADDDSFVINEYVELRVIKIIKLSSSKFDNPVLQKKKIPLEFVRRFPYLRPKTNLFFLVFKIRSFLSIIINNFFHDNNFILVSTPLITEIDTEGAGETFRIFSEKSKNTKVKNVYDEKEIKIDEKNHNLTVSGQLHLEFFTQGFGRVYNFSPCFRAEKSHTTRHLSEFWMIETEFICCDINELIDFTERFLKHIFFSLLNDYHEYFDHLERRLDNFGLLDNLKKISDKNFLFKRISYDEAVNILKNNSFEFEWGNDFSPEHENYICYYFSSPVFVTCYPRESKAFYMKESEKNKKTVDCFDLFFPKIGEIIGGSIREDNFEVLEDKIRSKGLKNLKWYKDLRIYGYERTGGFGLGLERLLMYICGLDNIRDVIPFPYLVDD